VSGRSNGSARTRCRLRGRGDAHRSRPLHLAPGDSGSLVLGRLSAAGRLGFRSPRWRPWPAEGGWSDSVAKPAAQAAAAATETAAQVVLAPGRSGRTLAISVIGAHLQFGQQAEAEHWTPGQDGETRPTDSNGRVAEYSHRRCSLSPIKTRLIPAKQPGRPDSAERPKTCMGRVPGIAS